jgi:hypothetical protein
MAYKPNSNGYNAIKCKLYKERYIQFIVSVNMKPRVITLYTTHFLTTVSPVSLQHDTLNGFR